MPPDPAALEHRAHRLRQAGFVAAVLAACGAVWLLPGGEAVLGGVEAIQAQGRNAAVVVGVLYVLGTIAFMPVSLLTLACGYLFGPVWGFLLAWPCEVLGAVISFGLARTLLYRRAHGLLTSSRLLSALDAALHDDDGRLVLLVRLSPFVPFAALNYALGVTGVRAGPYGIATMVGTAPVCFLYVYAGSSLSQLSAVLDGSADIGGSAATWAGLAVTALAVVAVSRAARAALHDAAGGAAAETGG